MDVRFHVRHECSERQVTCRFPGCVSSFRESQRDHHEKFDCEVLKARAKMLQQVASSSSLMLAPPSNASQHSQIVGDFITRQRETAERLLVPVAPSPFNCVISQSMILSR